MEILHDLEPKTNHIRLDAGEYLILHTPSGTLDVDTAKSVVDFGEKASNTFTIVRWNSDAGGKAAVLSLAEELKRAKRYGVIPGALKDLTGVINRISGHCITIRDYDLAYNALEVISKALKGGEG